MTPKSSKFSRFLHAYKIMFFTTETHPKLTCIHNNKVGLNHSLSEVFGKLPENNVYQYYYYYNYYSRKIIYSREFSGSSSSVGKLCEKGSYCVDREMLLLLWLIQSAFSSCSFNYFSLSLSLSIWSCVELKFRFCCSTLEYCRSFGVFLRSHIHSL